MNENTEIMEGDDSFPWEDVEASRNNQKLQQEHPAADAKREYLRHAKSCPQCRAAADHLTWFFFESPPETWDLLCGRAGWMTVCDNCRRQVDFFCELMN